MSSSSSSRENRGREQEAEEEVSWARSTTLSEEELLVKQRARIPPYPLLSTVSSLCRYALVARWGQLKQVDADLPPLFVVSFFIPNTEDYLDKTVDYIQEHVMGGGDQSK